MHLERADIPLIDEIKAIDEQLAENPAQPELWMERGKILRKKQKLCREAIESHSMGLTFEPFNALLYRHRGHVCINVGRYIEGAADFEISLRINPLNWDSWYHLGLAYYLLNDYQRARKAYEGCLAITKDEESLVAVTDWYWLTMMHLGDVKLATEALDKVSETFNIVENLGYFKRVLVYKGLLDAMEVFHDAETFDDNVLFATQSYGLSYYLEHQGKLNEAYEILRKIMDRSDDAWSCFAVHATSVRLHSWK
ncbi:MAG: hypothetical protein A2029_05870 [Chloroflexi bacterium RBG_19FT_COMBO_47_9]|nr:MAG: hypothetical protein A2Y53_06075 [Chloroflexi bacterium RBG_16_47_49]OGO59991.1 MAG: hypothetical protein A2029_05870 [Chloroflexi bacterium RBG_19FT_COMBO_47_9]